MTTDTSTAFFLIVHRTAVIEFNEVYCLQYEQYSAQCLSTYLHMAESFLPKKFRSTTLTVQLQGRSIEILGTSPLDRAIRR